MRKLIAIFLSFCLLFLTTGFHLSYKLQLAEAKEAMKQRLHLAASDAVLKLVFSAGERQAISWEDETEFRFNGTLYDVLKTETAGDKIVIWCLGDQNETALVDEYLRSEKEGRPNAPSNIILKLLASPFVASQTTALPVYSCCLFRAFGQLEYSLAFAETAVATPPPQPC